MASVFLSYDREDVDRAGKLAAAIEKAGHKVWWDRHIKGGAQYSKEIEQALKAAEAVVVLWSERSVESAWVRDEAAAGRDTGRLVPVLIDNTPAPLGFRQYQATELSRWKGSANAPAFQEMLRAIESLAATPTAEPAKPTQKLAMRRPRLGLGLILAMVAAAVLIAGLAIWRPWSSGDSQAIAVAAADSSPVSQNLARELLAQLGQLQNVSSGGLALVGGDQRRRASLVFEVSGTSTAKETRANLVLLDSRTGNLLWSKPFDRPAAQAGDLRQQFAYTAAQVLECALEAHRAGRAILQADALKLYLNGCAELAQGDFNALGKLIPIFRQVIAAAPKFDGAWSKLLIAEDLAYPTYGDSPKGRQLIADLRRDIAAARKINPELAGADVVESNLLPLNAFDQRFSLIDRAAASDPHSSMPLIARSQFLFSVGRGSDALDDARRAAELDPISPGTRSFYILALAQAGRTQAALDEIARAERIWPGASTITLTRFAIHLRFGDPRIAWQMIESSQTPAGWIGARSFIDARIDPTPAKVERAIKDLLSVYADDRYAIQHVVQAMSILDREKELLDLLMRIPLEDAIYVTDVSFRPAARELWRNPNSFAYALRVDLLQYWQKSGKWPDFCFEPDLPYDCKAEAAKLARPT